MAVSVDRLPRIRSAARRRDVNAKVWESKRLQRFQQTNQDHAETKAHQIKLDFILIGIRARPI